MKKVGNYNLDNANFTVMIEAWDNDYTHWYHCDGDLDFVCDICLYDYCDHKCHDNGFFWKITNFFNRFFRINRFCECGITHW